MGEDQKAQFQKVANRTDLSDGEAIAVDVADKTIAIFQVEGSLYAIDDMCSHEEAPLCEGVLEGFEIECPWHAARFNIKTGKARTPPAYEDLCSYKVRFNGDAIELEL